MRNLLSVSASVLFAATMSAMSGCAMMGVPETAPATPSLKCGDIKDTQYNIPTTTKPAVVDIQFKLACEPGKKGVEISLKNHPWGGVGKTMPNSIGKDSPNYEYIPCDPQNVDLKAKWKDMEDYSDFASRGRDIKDINNVQIDMRFRQDYALRHYMLYSARNICQAAP